MIEFPFSKLLCLPEDRISVAKFLITEQLKTNIPRLRWVAGYGSFWNLTTRNPHDLDISVDIDPMNQRTFDRQIGRILHINFGLLIDIFPISLALSKYGKDRTNQLIEQSVTIYGQKPQLF